MKKILPAILLVIGTFSYSAAQSNRGDRDDDKKAVFAGFQSEKDDSKVKIDVFPNPAFENVFVRIVSNDHPNVKFELYNIIGTTLNVENEEIERNYYKIGLKEFPAGYYLLMVKDPDKHYNQAFKIHKSNK